MSVHDGTAPGGAVGGATVAGAAGAEGSDADIETALGEGTGASSLLVPLGDDAAICVDGFCEVPARTPR